MAQNLNILPGFFEIRNGSAVVLLDPPGGPLPLGAVFHDALGHQWRIVELDTSPPLGLLATLVPDNPSTLFWMRPLGPMSLGPVPPP
jgi:hypothetical protein